MLAFICIFFSLYIKTNDKHNLQPQPPRRSMSPSPRRLADIKKKQSSIESNGSTTTNGSATITDATIQQTDAKGNNESNGAIDGKFENISDNGSEISDEGYRSLGLIQQANNNNQSKRISLHSQTSPEDVKTEGATKIGELYNSIIYFKFINYQNNVGGGPRIFLLVPTIVLINQMNFFLFMLPVRLDQTSITGSLRLMNWARKQPI